MNAAAKALAQGSISNGGIRSIVLSRHNFGLIFLVIAVLVSAFSVVYVKDLNRRLFVELQSLQQVRDALQVEWGQLLLEQNTWATQARVQHIAQQGLEMVVPESQAMMVVG